MLVLDHQAEEASELLGLASQIGVEKRVVAFAPAPEHVVGAAELVGGFEGLAHLRGRAGEDLGVGVGCGAGGVPGMAE